MDSCAAALNTTRAHLVRAGRNGVLGESTQIRHGFNNKDLCVQFCKKLQIPRKMARNVKPGVAHSVLTSDTNHTPVEHPVTMQPSFIEIRPEADPKNVVAIILGGGAGTRLFPLTRQRAKPAVPLGGSYRLIDVPMSNCINSGIAKIFILTQFNSFSLNRHLARTYRFGDGMNFENGFVEVLAATQTPGEAGNNWFRGTADAVRQFLWVFEDARHQDIEHILILPGDHLYRMDYMDLVQNHTDTDADITVSCVPMDYRRAYESELMKIDHTGRIIEFSEKPKGPELMLMRADTTLFGLSGEEAVAYPYIGSMGVYVFKKDVLLHLLKTEYPSSNDFETQVIPSAIGEYNVQASLFNDYWVDIGTIKSFFAANLALAEQPPKFDLNDPETPFYTDPSLLPPTKVENCRIVKSLVSHGCFLKDCSIRHSIVGVRSRLECGVELQDTVMMGADDYQTDREISSLLAKGKVPVGVGQNTKIRNCIIDKNARIGRDVVIANGDGVEEADRPNEGFYIRSGITIVLKNATIEDGTVI